MKNLTKIIGLVLVILAIGFIFYSNLNLRKYNHYTIIQNKSWAYSIHSFHRSAKVEIKNGKIMRGECSFYDDHQKSFTSCKGTYLPNNNSGCWEVECEIESYNREKGISEKKYEERILPCDYYEILLAEDVGKKINKKAEEIENFSNSETFKIFKDKRGCNEEICYDEKGNLIMYQEDYGAIHFHWERRFIGV